MFVLAVNELVEQLPPTVRVLDNASIHQAHLVRDCQAAWAARGLTLLFRPPYSPELNKIGLLRHRCKHYWIRPEDYASDQTLVERVDYVLKNVGALYTVTFA